MLEKFKYLNHLGESVSFGAGGIFANYNDLRDYAWSYESDNQRISNFRRDIQTKSLPVQIVGKNDADAVGMKNVMMETFEKDVLAETHGRIVVGDYYLRCYVVESKKTNYLESKRLLTAALKIVTDFPFWVKETVYNFMENGTPLPDPLQGGKNLDYEYDFPFDFAPGRKSRKLDNTSFSPCNFRIIIYGGCVNPTIFIGGHPYQLTCEIAGNEYVVIDSIEKTIKKVLRDGAEENLFNARNRESYIFEKIPPGILNVAWSGEYGFDVILFEERSEPKWT